MNPTERKMLLERTAALKAAQSSGDYDTLNSAAYSMVALAELLLEEPDPMTISTARAWAKNNGVLIGLLGKDRLADVVARTHRQSLLAARIVRLTEKLEAHRAEGAADAEALAGIAEKLRKAAKAAQV